MNEELVGPTDDFLSAYLEYHYQKAKQIQKRARLLGISLEDLKREFVKNPETLEFELSLMEPVTKEENNEII